MSKTIEQLNYMATVAQVEALALANHNTTETRSRIDGTYLRILVACCQSRLDKTARRTITSHMQALEDASEIYYPAVLRGVTTPDIAPDKSLPQEEQSRRALERNRRSTFARSTKSTLAAFIRAGGDMRTLDVATVTKDSLLPTVAEAQSPQERENAAWAGAEKAIVRLTRRRAGESVLSARARLRHVIETLESVLDEITPRKRGKVVPITAARKFRRAA